MQRAPNSVALRVPGHIAGRAGGCHRRAPTGGARKGIPRNAFVVPSDLPSSLPVSTLACDLELAACRVVAVRSAVPTVAANIRHDPNLLIRFLQMPGGQYHSRKAAWNGAEV